MPSAVLELVVTTLKAVVEVFLLCVVGYFLARRGIVDAHTKKRLNLINVSFFTPCLLFSKVAFTLTPAKLADLYIVPIGFILSTFLSAAIGWAIAVAFRLPKSKRNFAMACSMFMNCNSLPVALMQSLVATVPSLRWGEDDDKEAMLGRALSYLVLCSTLGIIFRWSFGVNLLSSAEDDPIHIDDVDSGSESDSADERNDDDQRPLLSPRQVSKGKQARSNGKPAGSGIGSSGNSPTVFKTPATPGSTVAFALDRDPSSPDSQFSQGSDIPPQLELPSAAQGSPPAIKTRPLPQRKDTKTVFASFPGTPREWRTPAASVKSRPGSAYDLAQHAREAIEREEEEEERQRRGDDEEQAWGNEGRWTGNGRREGSEPSRNKWQRAGRRTWSFAKKTGKRIANFMTAPLYAALLSIIVALIPPLQALLDDLTPLRGALKSAGNCSVPITLVVLGAYFYTPSPTTAPTKQNVKPGPQYPHPKHASNHSNSNSHSDEGHYDSIAPRLENPPSPQFMSPRSSDATLVGKFKAWKAKRRERSSKKTRKSKAEKRKKMEEAKTIAAAVLARMIIAPAILLPLLAFWAKKTRNVADDPVFIMVACLVVGSPPAITLAQMTQAVGESFERLISNTLLVSYAIITPITTIILVLCGLVIDAGQDNNVGHHH